VVGARVSCTAALFGRHEPVCEGWGSLTLSVLAVSGVAVRQQIDWLFALLVMQLVELERHGPSSDNNRGRRDKKSLRKNFVEAGESRKDKE
jgi:hypothetical protein